MRYYFGQFGLGVKTGIDLPNETAGQRGRTDHMPGFLLDLSIGQYDTYTPLQLAQYVSNNCKWWLPHAAASCKRNSSTVSETR